MALKKIKKGKVKSFSLEDVKKFREDLEKETKKPFRDFFLAKTICWNQSKRIILD